MRKRTELWLVLALAAFVAISCLQVLAQTESQEQQAPGSESQEGMRSMATGQDVQARVQARLDRLSSELNLTDDQKTKLKPILQSEIEQFRTIGNDTSMTRDQKRSKMQEVRSTYKPQIEAVLTPEQKQKLANMREESSESQQPQQ